MSDRLYIPEFYSEDIKEDVTFKRASFYFQHWGEGDDLLDKLIKFEEFYDLTLRKIHGNVHDRYKFDDDFYSEWRWEICYFNCLFSGFQALFHGTKEVA